MNDVQLPKAVAPAPRRIAAMRNKVPAATLDFWIVKILATTVGETAADFLSETLHLGLSITSGIVGLLLVVALAWQFRRNRYIPWVYWIAVVLISIAGTLITDKLVDDFGVPLAVTTAVFAVALATTFATWYARERTLSIHTIFTIRREAFYWAAILFSFALGTAAGDLATDQLGLGFGTAALIFGGLIAAVTACYYGLRLNAVLAFWLAYVLTRPLGASLGDLLSQPVADGGLGLGTTATSAAFLATIMVLVALMQLRGSGPTDAAQR